MNRLAWAYLLAATAVLPACSPWTYGEGDFFAGTVDGTKYPDIYRGGTTKEAGGEIPAIVAGTLSTQSVILTYNLAMPAVQTDMTVVSGPRGPIGAIPELALALEPVDVQFLVDPSTGLTGSVAAYPTAPQLAYTFDPTATEPFAATQKCTAPANYLFDARTEGYRKDYQGPIFTELPSQKFDPVTGEPSVPPFVPYMAEVAVATNSSKCQSLKDEEQLLKSKDVAVPMIPADGSPGSVDSPKPSGKLVAFYPVDPRVGVGPGIAEYSQTGIWGSQQWGWYKHYLFAYIDGGYIPTQAYSVDSGGVDADTMMPVKLEFEGIRTQKWFYPAKRPTASRDPDTGEFVYIKDDMGEYLFRASAPGLSNASAAFAGMITDVVEAGRGEAGYSPVCELCEFEGSTADWDEFLPPKNNPIPLFTNIATAVCTGQYVYCPQQAN